MNLLASDAETILGDLEAMGASPAQIEQARAGLAPRAEPAGACEVYPENVTAIRLLVALQTQWRFTAVSTWSSSRIVKTGLDYGVLDITARSRGLDVTPEDFARLQVAEVECLAAWHEEASR